MAVLVKWENVYNYLLYNINALFHSIPMATIRGAPVQYYNVLGAATAKVVAAGLKWEEDEA